MTKQEAINALKEGKKITHSTFTKTEFVKLNHNNLFEFEDGVICGQKQFWEYRTNPVFENGYSIYNPN